MWALVEEREREAAGIIAPKTQRDEARSVTTEVAQKTDAQS